MARLATHIWVDALLARLNAEAVPYVLKRGARDAGAVLVRVATLDGQARLSERVLDLSSGAYLWQVTAEGPEAEIDAITARACARDPDLWLIEIDDARGRDFLGSM